MPLYHEKISFKKLTQEHVPLLITWFSEPHVRRWWPILEKDEVVEHFLKRIRSKDTFGYIVTLKDTPIGYIQYYYIDPTGEKTGKCLPKLPTTTVGTDQFIGDPLYINKGVGTRMIKEFITYLGRIEPNITTLIVDPEPTNYAAIRCYEKVGFKRVGVYKTPWGSSLLMRYDIQ